MLTRVVPLLLAVVAIAISVGSTPLRAEDAVRVEVLLEHAYFYVGQTINATVAVVPEGDGSVRNPVKGPLVRGLQVRARGARFMELLNERFGQHANVGDIRGRGLFVGMEFVADRETKEPFAPELNVAGRFKAATFENGLICYPSGGTADGERGDHVLLAPPFIISEAQLEELVDKLDKSLSQVIEAVS